MLSATRTHARTHARAHASAHACAPQVEAFKSGTKTFGSRAKKSRRTVADMLFDVLDFDHSGQVSFKVRGFEGF